MEERVGARSSREIKKSGLRSVPQKSGERSRQRDLSQNPWSSAGRKNPANQKATNIENLLRYALLRKGINFIEQASIGPWSIDFLLPDYMACVEADGEFWHSSMAARLKDRRKDAWLRSKGYLIFHFDGKELIQDSDYCVDRMMKSIQTHMDAIVQAVKIDLEEENNGTIENNTEIIRTDPIDDEYEQWLDGSS